MTEDQIERAVQRKVDSLDARFMATGSTMTQADYDAAMAAITAWAEREESYALAANAVSPPVCPRDDKPCPHGRDCPFHRVCLSDRK